ncbi:MAG: hypothetical protein GXP30_11725 [Verrucomicrobia bacterium]|nr:hypothetical protein [Verrucomicrobiota bacterium]
MKIKKLTSWVGVSVAMVAIMGVARADNTLTYTKVDKGGATGEAQKMLIRSGKVRIDLPGGKNAMIYDAAANKIFILELKAKSYTAMDPATMKQMMGALSAMQAQLEAKMAAMPEAQQAQMRAMMSKLGQGMLGGGKTPVVKSVETGRKEKVGDYNAEVVEVSEDGIKAIEYFVVDRGELKIGDVEYATLLKFQAFFGELMKSLPGPMKQKMNVQMMMAKGNRLPVKAVHYENKEIKRTDQLTEVSSDPLAPALFEIPAGFQQRQLPIGAGAAK